MGFIRVKTSQDGIFDVTLGPAGTVLTSNGVDVAPSFQSGNARHGFSYTQTWERDDIERFGGFDFGIGNYTAEFERRSSLYAAATSRGPACYTSACDEPFLKRI